MKLKRFKLFVEESQYKNQEVNTLIDFLQDKGYEIIFSHSKAKNNNIIVAQFSKDRKKDYEKLMTDLKELNPIRQFLSYISSEDIIGFSDSKIKIIIKDTKKLTVNKESDKNEKWLVEEINNLIAQHGKINLLLIDKHNKKIPIKNIIEAVNSAKETATATNTGKADVIFRRENGKNFSISIKRISADFYASLNTVKEAEELGMKALFYAIKTGETALKSRDKDQGYQITKSLAIPVTNKELLHKWMFGSDINISEDSGTIMIYDYHKSKLKELNEKTYELQVELLINDMSEVTEKKMGDKYPVICILNHDKHRLGPFKGINARLSTKKRVSANVVSIDEKILDRMNKIPTFEEIINL